ncbi:hypothetical protein GCM10010228_58270 [Streptomyces massasporeus]|nr:hypothetical protein GCM10010228_58270 [Streptomyces massasporeus]
MGMKRLLISAADVTAPAMPPPEPRVASRANWADPEKTAIEQITGARCPQPCEVLIAPKLTASRKEAAASPDPVLSPDRKLARGETATFAGRRRSMTPILTVIRVYAC